MTPELGRLRGGSAGPTLIVVGGIHGNEPAGVDAEVVLRPVALHPRDERAAQSDIENAVRARLAAVLHHRQQ